MKRMGEAKRIHKLIAGLVVGGVRVVDGRRWLAAMMLLVAVALVRAPTFVHELFDPDEASIAVQATTVLHGGTLYVDVADRKPPLPPLIYAAVFRLTGTHDLRPLHGLVAVAI